MAVFLQTASLTTWAAPPAREYSEETARAIDEEISRLIKEGHDRVKQILTEKRDQLEILSATLLEKETLQGEELQALLDRPSQ